MSLFYGDEKQLTTSKKHHLFLPSELYGSIVRDTVVCCVDILLVRMKNGKKEALLVERSSEPAKGLWWLPGGRLVKGETFFAAAKRKARQETGIAPELVTPIQVLGVWNTFFPFSSWDTETDKGTQTVNPIVLVEMKAAAAEQDIKLDNQSETYRWIGLDPELARARKEDRYVMQALLRLQAWDPSYSSKPMRA